jgi:hypothetical protein
VLFGTGRGFFQEVSSVSIISVWQAVRNKYKALILYRILGKKEPAKREKRR